MRPAKVNFPEPLVQGDTLETFTHTFTQDGGPLAISAANVQLVDTNRRQIHNWTTALSGSTVICERVDGIITKNWPASKLTYGVELVLADGTVISPITGTLEVLRNTVYGRN